ncbi:YqaJ viral recombinase family protein [Microbacterium sp. NFH-22A-Y]|uniref:YqaJ viral recombinase family protein n=1 Tax=Microbacterium sp. NFH-22A-Y TaxID=2744448 RepID=UPI001F410F19|nr:YqaJ viral recombinase family protein [Microbacterium sp. NFH-22A-Y]
MSALAVLGRTLADSADRESWLAVHDKVIGSSTAGKFAKPGSVETYVRQILEPRTFSGNESTRSGNDWEPALLGAVGARPNSLFIHHPDNRRFGATIDGTKPAGDGFAIVETKTKHNRIVTDPTPYEIRQLAWQLYCIPEAVHAEWVWGEIVPDEKSPVGWRLRRPIQSITFERDDTRIVAATTLIVPIAHAVLAALTAAQTQRVPF